MRKTIDEVGLRNLTLVTVATMNYKEPGNLEETTKILLQCDQGLKQSISAEGDRWCQQDFSKYRLKFRLSRSQNGMWSLV